jgi:hypothetical protein
LDLDYFFIYNTYYIQHRVIYKHIRCSTHSLWGTYSILWWSCFGYLLIIQSFSLSLNFISTKSYKEFSAYSGIRKRWPPPAASKNEVLKLRSVINIVIALYVNLIAKILDFSCIFYNVQLKKDIRIINFKEIDIWTFYNIT